MTQELRLPRLVIAAPQGRSGKTTVTLGLCAALRARGLKIQPYKKGPDYIDPSWLSESAGRACRSLDPFFYAQPESLLQAFVNSARDADLSLIEGNHGLFDSFDETGAGSTAAVARTLNAPILLVVNATRLGRSAAAIVHGCQTFEANTNIAGVVLNHVARGRHEARIRDAIETHCHIPVVGAIPRDENLTIPDRHLGLIPRAEEDTFLSAIMNCQQAIEKYLNLGMILRIAELAPPIPTPVDTGTSEVNVSESRPRVGILRDSAFTFYYPENLEALENAGAELVFINALTDAELPLLDALYIGGGFPEIFMDELSANASLRGSVKSAAEDKLPIYAECGGMMYLSRLIIWGEKSAEMVGLLPCEVEMTNKPQGHGYVIAQVDQENPFFTKGTILRGHEFHNSRVVRRTMVSEIDPSGDQSRLSGLISKGRCDALSGESLNTAYRLSRGNGLGNGRDGIVVHNVLASYTHLHAGGAPSWAMNLVQRARMYRERAGSRA